MKTKFKNATEAIEALTENFELLVTGKRNVSQAKAVNDTIGKVTNIVRTQVIEKMRIGDKDPIWWLSDHNEEFNRLIQQQKEREVKPLEFGRKAAS